MIMNRIKQVITNILFCLLSLSAVAQSAIKENPYLSYYYEGWKNMADQNFKKANIQFTAFIEKQPEQWYGYYGRAFNNLQSGKLVLAENDIYVVLKYGADEPEVFDLAGKIYLSNGDPESAKAYFLNALKLMSLGSKAWIDLADTYTNLGLSYLQLKKNDSAFWYLDKSINLKAHNPEAYYFLGLHNIQENARAKACHYLAISEYQGGTMPDDIKSICGEFSIEELDTLALNNAKLIHQIYTDTVYLTKWGRWTNRKNAHYARLATFNIGNAQFQGNFNDYDLLGNLIHSGYYDEFGKLTGIFKAYHANGILKASGVYKNSLKEGMWQWHDEQGMLQIEETFEKGVLQQAQKMSENYDKLISASIFSEWLTPNNSAFKDASEAVLSWQVLKSDYPFIRHLPPHGLSKRELTELYNESFKGNTDDSEVYTIVENQPEFPGGIAAFYKKVSENMEYPVKARKKGIEGRVFVQFVVNELGEITDVKSVKGIGYGCDEAALQAVKAAGPFIPGYQRGKPVKVKMVVPIIFSLSSKSGDYQIKRRTSDLLRDF